MRYDWDLRREEGELTSWRHGLYIKASVTYFSTSKHKEWALKWPKYLFLQIGALGLVDFNLRWALHAVVYLRKSDALNACTCEGLIFYAFFWGTEVPGVFKLDLNFQAKETKSWFTQNCLSLVYILRGVSAPERKGFSLSLNYCMWSGIYLPVSNILKITQFTWEF